jgi:hypothetical protein
LKLQYNVQRFSLKHLQKIESNKSLSAKNDKDQQMQLRQAEKDYYELFEALSERERAAQLQAGGGTSPFLPFMQPQAQQAASSAVKGSVSNSADATDLDEGSLKLGPVPVSPHRPRFQEEEKHSSDDDATPTLRLDDFVGGRSRNARAVDELNASSVKLADRFHLPHIVTNDFQSPPATAAAAPEAHSTIKRTVRSSATTPGPAASARSLKQMRRGLSAKFDEESNVQSVVVKPMPPALHLHDGIYQNWSKRSVNNIPIHKAMSVSMTRATEVISDHDAFCRRFEQECRRTFEHVHTLSGILEVTPMQALRLPECKNPMLVRVSYGETVKFVPVIYLAKCLVI